MKKTHHVDENGYYGSFGGAYIPEMLFPNTEELRTQYLDIMGSESFKKEFDYLLRDYVGRGLGVFHTRIIPPTPWSPWSWRIHIARPPCSETRTSG